MRNILAFLFLALLLAACRQKPLPKVDAPAGAQIAPANRDVAFPMPQVPDFLVGTEDRVRYALENFWHRYDFNDTTQQNREVAEQGFANFLSLLSHADSALAACAIDRYLAKGFALESLRHIHQALIRHYLDHPDSPLRNDELYLHFLRRQLPLYADADVAERERCAFLLQLVGRNRVGTVAHDFSFVDRHGKRGTLHKLQSPYTLLLFNDPDCESCREQMPFLVSDPLLQQKALKVLAVYPEPDTEQWRSAQEHLPAAWVDACSPDGEIRTRALYYLPALPALYLLDAQKRVILKDTRPEQLRQFIATHIVTPQNP